MDINFKQGYLPDTSFNAWTRYEVDEEENLYNLDVIFNKHFYKFPGNKQMSIIIHELIHCAFYQMHANKLLSDEEVISLNEMIDNNYPTLYFCSEGRTT